MEKIKIDETEEIVEETQREAIINRPYNLAGSIKRVKKERFNVKMDSISYGVSNIVPALLKLFMESLDNPIDVAIKGGCNIIDIRVDEKSIRVKDNGYGVSTLEDAKGESILLKAFSKYNTSSNYKEKKGKGQKGVNGIGIKLCTTLSKYFEVTSEDKHNKKKIIITENNLNSKIKDLKKTGKTGLEVYFEPDFNIFDVDEIDEEHISRMYEYTLMQALTYPEITFKFNGKAVRIKPKQFLKLLSDDIVMEEHDNYFFGIVPNDSGDFKQLSYVNGLEIVNGGTHVEVVLETIIKNLRTKIAKKYKSIKPGDIRSKLTFVLIAKNMKNIDWEGQVKDKIASTSTNIKKYFSETDLDKFSEKVYKNKTIIDSIINYFKIAEEFKRQQELSKMDKKTKKKPKDEKFLAPVGEWNSILLCEGDSAANSIASILGRKGLGYYKMFGVPPNGYDMAIGDIIDSVKLKAINKITGLQYSKNYQTDMNFKNIIFATDADLPGFFIRGQLLGLFYRFGPNLIEEGRIKILSTPLFVVNDIKENIVTWFYDFESQKKFERENEGKGYTYEYKKGLSGWDKDELQTVIDKDGFENMLDTVTMGDAEDAKKSVDDWLNSNKADRRKEMLDGYKFSILNM